MLLHPSEIPSITVVAFAIDLRPTFLDKMLSLTAAAALLVLAYAATYIYSLIRNLYLARKSGFPVVVIPWDQNNLLWMITSNPLQSQLQKWLPKSVFDRIVLTIYGSEYNQRRRPFDKYATRGGNGKSMMMATCGKLSLVTCDPEIANEILRRPRDFHQTDLASIFMGQFGPSALTSDGEAWSRQHKVIASAINERISKAVFSESLRQTEGLIGEVFRHSSQGSNSADSNRVFDMIKRIAIHVLSGAGMGVNTPWADSANETPSQGFSMTYVQAVRCLTDNLTGPIILPQWFLANYPSFLPGSENFHNLSVALKEFPIHTTQMMAAERQRSMASKGGEWKNNIMSQMLQASEGGSNNGKRTLTDEEIMGNLFLFTSAGFDTTANTMAYGLVFLARYPHWQDWLQAEVDQVVDPSITNEQLEYSAVFPKLTRVLAFMLEILRFFPPLVALPKQTVTEQTITTSTGTYIIPAKTSVNVNVIAINLDPEVYRNVNLAEGESGSEDDEVRFRPSRWVNPPGSSQALYQAPKCTFLPWSTGPRVCPGMKMAQVEFCAVMLALLREHRVEAVPVGNESTRDVEARLDDLINNSMSAPTLQIPSLYNPKADGGLQMRLRRRSKQG